MTRTMARRSARSEVRGPAAIPAAVPNTLTTLPLAVLRLGALNPRTHFDAEKLAELANSIAQDGVLQNLVVRPSPGEAHCYEIVCGGRRYRAAKSLVEAGRADPAMPVPVRIVDLDDLAALRMATVENVQRQDMTPLEEAAAFAGMVELGDTPDTIAALTGMALKTVQQRLALHHRLAPAVRDALDGGRINLGQAQAFTVAARDRQEDLLPAVLREGAIEDPYSAGDIRSALSEDSVPMSRAIFDRSLYTGPRVADLFGPEETYAADRDEFRRLQHAAAEARKNELAGTWAWAELRVGGHFDHWSWDCDRSPAQGGGVIVHLKDDLAVAEYTGLVSRKRSPDPEAPGRSAAAPLSGSAPKTRFSRAHLVWARQEKSRRLQVAIAHSPQVALSLAILALLGEQEISIRKVAPSGAAPEDRIENDALKAEIETRFAWAVAAEEQEFGSRRPRSGAKAFRALMRLSVIERQSLLSALVAETFATWPTCTPALGDTPLAIAVADELALAPRPFVPTPDYLQRLSRAELLRVAWETGIAEDLGAMKKGEMVDAIALAPDRDEAWWPTELEFGLEAALEAGLAAKDRAGGAREV